MKPEINNNIAQTGLRTLFVLQMLIRGPISKTQILYKISKNPYLKNVAADTIRLDINTLKSVGFDIKSGHKGNSYCYELKLNPIKITLDKNELKAIDLVKKAMFNFLDFRYIISLYCTFEKISKLVEPDEVVNEILNFGNFLNIDINLIRELDVHSKHNNEIVILYDSPRKGQREMTVTCRELKYSKKNDKLYLWCNCSEYEDVVYLRGEKIKKIVKINKFNTQSDICPKTCVYKISRKSNSPFELEDFEKITRITPCYIQIKAGYLNEFHLIQRLLSFGEDLIYIDNDEIKERLRQIISEIKGVYS